jgi:hypothetical protein
LTQLREAVVNRLLPLSGTQDILDLNVDQSKTLDQFLESAREDSTISREAALKAIQATLAEDPECKKIGVLLISVMQGIEETGLLKSLTHEVEQGNQRLINVFSATAAKETSRLASIKGKSITVEANRVRAVEVAGALRSQLQNAFRREFNQADAAESVADLIHNFLVARLPETLTYRADLSDEARREAVMAVPTAMIPFAQGVSPIVRSGKPFDEKDMEILKIEHEHWLRRLTLQERIVRCLAFIGMLAALYLLCGLFIYYQFEKSLLTSTSKLVKLLALSIACLLGCSLSATDPFRVEIIPIVLTSITATIVYGRSLALMLMTAIALAATLALGFALPEFVVLGSAAAASILMLGRIRTRTRLVYVGCATAGVVLLTAIGVGIMVGQTTPAVTAPLSAIAMSISPATETANPMWWLVHYLFFEAGRQAILVIIASLVMTGLLPIVERAFGVQTDLSLLELGDASHPLLRQLAQRAPGTYNHSINVAALAESAADSIGAHGLLTRVGAYFHDIGKMFNPNYFIENQAHGNNYHDTLQPAMSTLVIIAHVKDGADLARKEHLPQPLIDFIEQHHGTTLVEYFYRQATKKGEASGEEVSELNFRYPGPKPQTREAAVLMLADAVESASRAMVEPTPGRIQNLVDQIATKRLLDHQFDDCGLTLCQLDQVKKSLVKSLTAIYHGRVKYPGQQSA